MSGQPPLGQSSVPPGLPPSHPPIPRATGLGSCRPAKARMIKSGVKLAHHKANRGADVSGGGTGGPGPEPGDERPNRQRRMISNHAGQEVVEEEEGGEFPSHPPNPIPPTISSATAIPPTYLPAPRPPHAIFRVLAILVYKTGVRTTGQAIVELAFTPSLPSSLATTGGGTTVHNAALVERDLVFFLFLAPGARPRASTAGHAVMVRSPCGVYVYNPARTRPTRRVKSRVSRRWGLRSEARSAPRWVGGREDSREGSR